MGERKSPKSKWSFGLSSLDLVGGNFSFEFPTFSRKLKTMPGSGLTLVIGLIATIATVMIGSKYFDTSSPTVTFSNEVGPEVTHNLAKEKLLQPLTVYMEGAPLQSDISRFATIKVTSTTYLLNGPKGYFKVLSIESFDYVDCKELNDPYFNQILEKIDDRNKFKNILKCPDFKGNYSKTDILTYTKKNLNKYMWLGVFPCSREDPSECVAPSDVNKLRLVVTNTKKTIDPSNYTHPYKITVPTQERPINPSRRRIRQSTTKKTIITDLRNDFVGPQKKGEFWTMDLIFDDYELRPPAATYCPPVKPNEKFIYSCPSYSVSEFSGGSEVIQVKRKYNIPTEIIGEIGGVLKVALMFGMVYTIYNKAKKKSLIIKSVFSSRKKNRKNQVREKRSVRTREHSRPFQGSANPHRAKYLPNKKSHQRTVPTQHSQKVREESFKSKINLNEVIKNVNSLEILERIGLNEYSKALLPEALFIKRLIEQSPVLKQQFDYLKKKSEERGKKENPSKKQQNIEEIDENLHKKLNPVDLGSKTHEKEDKMKNLLKLFVERQIGNRPQDGIFNSKNKTKRWSSGLGERMEPEVAHMMSKGQDIRKKEILKSQRLAAAKKNQSSEEKIWSSKISKNSQNAKSLTKEGLKTVSRPTSLCRRANHAPPGVRSRKRFGSTASLGRKILFKSRFSPRKIQKKRSTKI